MVGVRTAGWLILFVLAALTAWRTAHAEIRNPTSVGQIESSVNFGTSDREVVFNSAGTLTGDPAVTVSGDGLLIAPLDFTPTAKTDDYTFAVGDEGSYIRFSSSGALSATIPANNDEPFPVGAQLPFAMTGGGTLTVAGDGGVTVTEFGGPTYTSAGGLAVKTGTNSWDLFGGVE